MLGANHMIVNEATAMQWLQRGLNQERMGSDLIVTEIKFLRDPKRIAITVLTEAAWQARQKQAAQPVPQNPQNPRT